MDRFAQKLAILLLIVCSACVALPMAVMPLPYVVAQAQVSEPNDTSYSKQWALEQIDALCAWEYTTGSADVTVAVLDTGVDMTHPDLVDRLRDDGYDFVDDDDDPMDENGHGTHVAGIVAATLNNAEGVAGLAPDVQILPVRVLDEEGSHDDPERAIASAIRYATEHGANVINMSLGMTYLGDEDSISPDVASAIEEAQEQNVLIVVASGNSYVPLPNVVASNNADVLVVAATDESDAVTAFSNTGPWVDVAAPGENIFSTMPTYEVFMTSEAVSVLERMNQDYDYMSGTSMAAPLVSGLAALVFSVHPDWSANQVQDAIKNTTFTGIYADMPDIYQRLQLLGTGRIDACAALGTDADIAERPTVTRPSAPTATPAPTSAEAVQVVQDFVEALQDGNIEAANALIDPDRPEVRLGVTDYLNISPAYLEQLGDARYEQTDTDNRLVQVEVYSTAESGRQETLVCLVSQVDGEWYIYDFEIPSIAR
jgi:type VII secretion-associated serine protease mycosin